MTKKDLFRYMWPGILFVGIGTPALALLSEWLVHRDWQAALIPIYSLVFVGGAKMRERLLKIHLKHPDRIRPTLP